MATDATVALRLGPEGVAWQDASLSLYGGTLTSSGVRADGATVARVSLSRLAVHELPAVAGRDPSAFARGRLGGSIVGRLDAGGLSAAGDLMLEEAALPALGLVRPALARYGLRPPNEDALGPILATVTSGHGRVDLTGLRIDLRGASLRGAIGVSEGGAVDGAALVTLEEEYLRTSKVLTLPRVLTDRLVLPVRVDGPLTAPRVQADLGSSLGLFLKDNRVRAFVTSAVEEAQILLGRPSEPPPAPEAPPRERPREEAALDAALRDALAAYAADFAALALRAARA